MNTINERQLIDLAELLEDTISYFADEEGVNASDCWEAAEAFAQCKHKQIQRLRALLEV